MTEGVCAYCGEERDDVRVVAGDPMCEECLEQQLQRSTEAELWDMELHAEAMREADEESET